MSLPWIKAYVDLPDHPKSDLLEALLGVRRAWTHVVELWMWAARVRPDGDLSEIPDSVIAKRSGWDADASAFVRAIREAGFLDADGRLHNWDAHQGAHREKIERDRDRLREKRRKVARPSRDRRATVARPSRENEATTPGEMRGDERRGEETPCSPPQSGDAAAGPADPPAQQPALIAPEQTHRPTREDILAGRYDQRAAKVNARDGPLVDMLIRCWKAAVCKPRSEHTPSRRKAIGRKLTQGYTPSQVCKALEGIARSPFHAGSNDEGKEYLDVTTALAGKMDEHIERWERGDPVAIGNVGPPGTGPPRRDTHGNTIALDGREWSQGDQNALEMGLRWSDGRWHTVDRKIHQERLQAARGAS